MGCGFALDFCEKLNGENASFDGGGGESGVYEQKMVSYVVDGDRVNKVDIHRKR